MGTAAAGDMNKRSGSCPQSRGTVWPRPTGVQPSVPSVSPPPAGKLCGLPACGGQGRHGLDGGCGKGILDWRVGLVCGGRGAEAGQKECGVLRIPPRHAPTLGPPARAVKCQRGIQISIMSQEPRNPGTPDKYYVPGTPQNPRRLFPPGAKKKDEDAQPYSHTR